MSSCLGVGFTSSTWSYWTSPLSYAFPCQQNQFSLEELLNPRWSFRDSHHNSVELGPTRRSSRSPQSTWSSREGTQPSIWPIKPGKKILLVFCLASWTYQCPQHCYLHILGVHRDRGIWRCGNPSTATSDSATRMSDLEPHHGCSPKHTPTSTYKHRRE